ncbi:hypothetical protein EVAR_21996_1 [Eumeta japonica]|uniref:Uncharacterized protein n=1 Tax=Eumeta variegata TaxID=151549 RepID=A0A4C1YYQ2_EUMVA|nr:hypothetical protein EVAR_21996_1 [Eumeta japonica]
MKCQVEIIRKACISMIVQFLLKYGRHAVKDERNRYSAIHKLVSVQVVYSSICPLKSALYIRCFIPIQETGNALVTPLGSRVSMCSDDHVLSDGSPAHLPFKYTTEKKTCA